jgi:hypothetical protein
MTKTMDCRRAEELFSDDYDGTLPEPLRSELHRHLASCAECRALRAALGEVVEALRLYPVVEPARDLAARAATAALVRPRAVRPGPRHVFALHVPAWLQTAAAGLALIATGVLLLAIGPRAPGRAANRLVEGTLIASGYIVEKKDRLVEDFRLLKAVIGTAFEGRIDRMNDRVEDYRRLLERRRRDGQDERKRQGQGPHGDRILEAQRPQDFEPKPGGLRRVC